MSEEQQENIKPTETIDDITTFKLNDALEEDTPKTENNKAVAKTKKSTELVDQQEDVAPTDIQTVEEMDHMLDQDFSLARKNIIEISKKGEEALKDMISLAKHSEHPRAFEVVGQLITRLTDINKDILGLHDQRNKTKKESREERGSRAPNDSGGPKDPNAVFVGSTTDLLKYLSQQKNEEKVIEHGE